MGDPAAASTERIRRTEHHRITDLIGKRKSVVHIFHDKGRCYRLADLLHGRLELQTILSFFDCLRSRTDKTHTVLS